MAKETKPCSYYKEELSKKRNRIEQRTIRVFKVPQELKEKSMLFEHAEVIAEVERNFEYIDTTSKTHKIEKTISYYISMKNLKAKILSKIIRGHWGIETTNHYVRDVSMDEDYSRIRVNPGNFARLRSFALNILRANKVKNVKEGLYINTMDLSKTLKLKGIT